MIKKIKNFIKLKWFKNKWRKANTHNETYAKGFFPIDKVSVGKKSYGDLNIYHWEADNEGLNIGSYVSIAPDVKFILGGNHRYDTISTYPFKVKLAKERKEAYSNGKITVCDDVWIGMNSIIMSGVTVGKGAVIAAGSVVVKDVPEYSIVGGNPARVIKYRFENEIINKLKKINLNELNEEYIVKNINLMYSSVSNEVIDKIIKDNKINQWRYDFNENMFHNSNI